jgi:LysR family nitrogen assimilation transcriptional regulator
VDLKQLEYFLRVVECGSFTAAASLLDISQPSLSRQVRLLEVELRHHLFTRNGRGAVATEAGKLLAEHARMILRQVDLAQESLSRMRSEVSGELTIGMPSSLARLVSIPLLTEFKKQFPGLHVSISDGMSIALEESLLNGRLDLALFYEATPSRDLATVAVLDEELLLISHASRAEPTGSITLAEVARLPLVMPRRPHEIRMIVERNMADLGCRPNIAFEVDSIPAILHLIDSGEQFAVLPTYAVLVYSMTDTYVHRRIVEPSLSSKLVLATAAKRTTSRLHEIALDLMGQVCGRVLEPLKTPYAWPAEPTDPVTPQL